MCLQHRSLRGCPRTRQHPVPYFFFTLKRERPMTDHPEPQLFDCLRPNPFRPLAWRWQLASADGPAGLPTTPPLAARRRGPPGRPVPAGGRSARHAGSPPARRRDSDLAAAHELRRESDPGRRLALEVRVPGRRGRHDHRRTDRPARGRGRDVRIDVLRCEGTLVSPQLRGSILSLA